MNVQQLAILAREIAQFCGSVCHLVNILHNEKRDATPDEMSPLIHHDSRISIALTGTDPNTIDYQPDELGRYGDEPSQLNPGGIERA